MMSQSNNGPNPLAHADSHLPLRPNADSRPSTTILPRSDTQISITSQQVSAIDITKSFIEAASGIYDHARSTSSANILKPWIPDNWSKMSTLRFSRLSELSRYAPSPMRAVSADAFQIMDSKMDSGHLGPGETLEDEYNVLRNLVPEEVIGIMDQILCHEVSCLNR